MFNVSEFAVAPSAVIVHDPVESGAIKAIEELDDLAVLNSTYLFRSVPDGEAFSEQHQRFVDVVGQNVDQIYYLADLVNDDEVFSQAHRNPNQVYTRDALITLPWQPGTYISSNMYAPIRRPEVATMEAAAQALGLKPLLRTTKGLYLEGGDVIPFYREGKRTLLVGYGRRTQLATLNFLAEALIPSVIDEIIGVQLAPWRINLDGGLVPVAEDVIIAHPESVIKSILINASGMEEIDLFGMFADLGMQVIDISLDDSLYGQAGNCLCLGERKIVCYDMTASATARLRNANIEVLAVPGSELVKGTGGPRCMSRPIYL